MSSNPDVLGDKMRQEWNHRSCKNAYRYIASERHEWPEDEFFLSGERDVRDFVDPYLSNAQFAPRDKRMLEVGCGVGRMTFALAKRFGTVQAVDISDEMIKRAKELQGRFGIGNVHFQVGNGKDLSAYPDESIDFVFSYIVSSTFRRFRLNCIWFHAGAIPNELELLGQLGPTRHAPATIPATFHAGAVATVCK